MCGAILTAEKVDNLSAKQKYSDRGNKHRKCHHGMVAHRFCGTSTIANTHRWLDTAEVA